ncbi:hypothetical protein BGZ52_002523, partial [Haplosporangium bisporale]
MATVVTACRSVTFTLTVSPDFKQTASTLEVNSFYSGYTQPQRIGLWSNSGDDGFYSYKVVDYNKETDEFFIKLVAMGTGNEYEFTGANKRPSKSKWEYWHCLDVDIS